MGLKTSLTLPLSALIVLLCIAATYVTEETLSTHWIWPLAYYFVHDRVISVGRLVIIDKTGDVDKTYVYGNDIEPSAEITITDRRYFRSAVQDIDVGLGESYVAGYWETDDIAKYLRLLFANYGHPSTHGYFYWMQMLSPSQWLNIWDYYSIGEHTVFKDQEIIHHHYDWGTSLFEAFLDDTMTYTAANFEYGSSDLERAQRNKVSRLLEKANIREGDKVFEIGFGFGYLASAIMNETAAASVTAITLSHDQLEYAHNRYTKYTPDTNISFMYRDYRHYQDGHEKFDAVISVEMVEAIGFDAIDTYFETIANSLKEGGRFVIQYTAFSTWAFPKWYLGQGQYFPTFVVKHIFPAHFIPDEQDIHASALRHGLELIHSEKCGLHYAKTLKIWLSNLIASKDTIVDVYGEDVFRTFKYYLAWSQSVYQTQILHEVQSTFVKTSSSDIGRNLDEQVITL